MNPNVPEYKDFSQFSVHDLEMLRIILRGGSVLDWSKLNITSEEEAYELVLVNELDPDNRNDQEYIHSVKEEAIEYLKKNFEFPVPRKIRSASIIELLIIASKKRGHHQVCACSLLKVMHIIHHYRGREARKLLPLTDHELFRLVETKIYRVVGKLLASDVPITELIGGRKHRDSLYTKIMAKPNDIAIQLFDKLRFRIVTRKLEDVWPVLNYLTRKIFPFNYIIPGETINTLFQFKTYCNSDVHLKKLIKQLPFDSSEEDELIIGDNEFSHPTYKVINFVMDMPVRIDKLVLELYGDVATIEEPVSFSLTEFQLVDRETEINNERGEASHDKYKERQKVEVERRLKLGIRQR